MAWGMRQGLGIHPRQTVYNKNYAAGNIVGSSEICGITPALLQVEYDESCCR